MGRYAAGQAREPQAAGRLCAQRGGLRGRQALRMPWPMADGLWTHTVEGFLNDSDDPTVWLRLEDVYTIPYRCYYSRNIPNLFLCGRIISASHMAFASARVMATCAVGGQAVGTAAAIAVHRGILPREVGAHIRELQQTLLRDDCYIPGIRNEDADDLLRDAQISASHALPGMRGGKCA